MYQELIDAITARLNELEALLGPQQQAIFNAQMLYASSTGGIQSLKEVLAFVEQLSKQQ